MKDIREESNNIINLLNTHKTFLISKWDFKIEKLIEDPKKSIEDVEKDIKETPNFPRGKETYITGYKIHDCRKEILESAEQFEKKTSPESAITERKTSILPYPILEETLKNMDIHPIIKKGIYALREDYNLKDYCVEYDIQREEINPEITPKEKKKKSLRELILAFLKKNGPSSVKQITLGVLNMGLVTQSKSPRMVVNSMLWKLCRDERYRQQDKKGAYYNPVILDNDRWRLKK